MKQMIIDLLLETERPGMTDLCAHMEEIGFFNAPCSGGNHLACEGGLAEHSYNVYRVMNVDAAHKLSTDEYNSMRDAIIITSLLHDLGKCGDYGKPNYVPNFVRSKKKNENGEYELVQSETKPYETNKELLYVPHEVRSIAIAERFISLTEEEEFAILYHNGLYGDFRYAISGKETPLYLLLHHADMWASRYVEAGKQPE
ncbi:MAG: HD family phosphohydrolase [Roseburia sp.]|nr:HD family phosphohydrolase [Roseburia sp.]